MPAYQWFDKRASVFIQFKTKREDLRWLEKSLFPKIMFK